MIRRSWAQFALLVSAAAYLGLSPSTLAAQRPASEDIIWPLPPSQPRIRYVGSLHSELDVGKKKSLGSRLKRLVLGTRTGMLGLRKPHDVYVDDTSRFYVVDKARGRVVLFDPKAREGQTFGGEGPGALSGAMGLGGDGRGHLYVADPGNQRVVVFAEDGTYVRAMGGPGVLLNPVDVAADPARDRIYVVDSYLHQVVLFDPQGELIRRMGKHEGDIPKEPKRAGAVSLGGGHGRGDSDSSEGPPDVIENRSGETGEFSYPSYADVAEDGTLYVCDALNFRVQAFDPDGNYLFELGRLGDGPGSFARPKGVAVDSEGHVYVADAAFNNVQIFDREG
ncbi:MAG: 6-bladed beta-propeller, partial [Candidatus Krumholzibacteria bacterium]|nr:6-bladed beta-propeller [Candidatus Krumholzibacteria bacterium]